MNKQLFEYHPIIGYRFIPNLQTRVQHESGGYLVKTNSLGFRSELEFTPERTKNYKRTLLFGDSYTAADGVSNKKRYSVILMQLLPETEIYNFGMPGTGTDQQYLIYNEYAKNIEHDLVMVVVLVENIRRVNVQYRVYLNEKNERVVFQKPYFELENNALVLKNIPVDPNQIRAKDFHTTEKKKLTQEADSPLSGSLSTKRALKTWHRYLQNINLFRNIKEIKGSGC